MSVNGQSFAVFRPKSNVPGAYAGSALSSVSVDAAAAVLDGGITTPSNLSEAELAEALRPILVRGGDSNLYRAIEPATAIAQAIKSGDVWAGGQSKSGAPAETGASPIKPLWLFNPSNPGHPVATDYRQSDPSSYPSRTVVFLQGNDQQGHFNSCSGIYVGAHTLLTAAHCLFGQGNGYPFWHGEVFTPSAVGATGNGTVTSAPFGSYGPANNNGTCFDAFFPSGWANNTNDSTWDFALIDFRRCGNPTINQTGWMGISSNVCNLPSVRLDGYPVWYTVAGDGTTTGVAPFNGEQPCGGTNPNKQYPFLCGMTGPASCDSSYLETDTINNTAGQSGGPWWETINGSPQVVGIDIAEVSYASVGTCGAAPCYRNRAHAVDNSYWNFIVSNSEIGH